MEYKHIIKTPPLPFLGNKRNWMRELYDYYQTHEIPSLVVDVFGGSGLCANLFKQLSPSSRVIWNDYDNYQARLNKIGQTNLILEQIRNYITQHTPQQLYVPETIDTSKPKFLPQHVEHIRNIIDSHDTPDYATIYANFNIRGQKRTKKLTDNNTYNSIRQTPIMAGQYLKGVERVRVDFRELLEKYDTYPSKVLFILDPPYIGTNSGDYTQRQSATDFYDVLDFMKNTKHSFISFTSSKSLLPTFIEHFGTGECLYDAKLSKHQTMSHATSWDEIAYIKH